MDSYYLLVIFKDLQVMNWIRRVWRYQKDNQNPEGQKTQWPKEKGQKDKQWSTKHYTEN